MKIQSFEDAAYMVLQTALREAISPLDAESEIQSRNEIGTAVVRGCDAFHRVGLKAPEPL